jgi:hypothetical protein
MEPFEVTCHQRKIREEQALENPRPVMRSMAGCWVSQITREQAESIIFKYEWLGTMPSVSRAHYGLFSPDGELIGVTCFGNGSGTKARNVCGPENSEKAICLERGACVHWAHKNAASFLIRRACKMASRDHGWIIFFAYSDESAGEIGTVYQAANWIYIGRGVGRGGNNTSRAEYISPDGVRISSRAMRRKCAPDGIRKAWPEYESAGWVSRRVPDKHKYVWIEAVGSLRERLLRFVQALPYPKRISS